MSRRPRRPARGRPALPPEVRKLFSTALAEDRFDQDRTTQALLPRRVAGRGVVSAQATGTLSGNLAAAELARSAGLRVVQCVADGRPVRSGTVVLIVAGDVRRILGVERPLLNLLMHLSGVATATAHAVDAAGGRLDIRGTRKTIPGLRDLEKAAIVDGGGHPHRRDLSDGLLVKNNHLELMELEDAIQQLRALPPPRPPIEVEVQSRSEALRALAAGAEELLLDNRTPGEARGIVAAVRRAPGGRRIPIELSGGITRENLPAYARTGANSASMGSLTHSAPALPFHLTVGPVGGHRRRPERPVRG
jgi:nicotinate-nucleotide pyrophosphorylase (carboxylating)